MDRALLDELRKREPWIITTQPEGPPKKEVTLTVAERDALFAYIDELEAAYRIAYERPNDGLRVTYVGTVGEIKATGGSGGAMMAATPAPKSDT